MNKWRVPFWFCLWQARRNGRIDGKLGMPFETECKCCKKRGWPVYVIYWRNAGEHQIERIVQEWEKIDKPLKEKQEEAATQFVDVSERLEVLEDELDHAKQAFEEVKEMSGRFGFSKYILIAVLSIVEISYNQEPIRNLFPNAPDLLNLLVAFFFSFVMMFLAEYAGECVKQKNWPWAIGIGGLEIAMLLVFGVFREDVLSTNQQYLVAQGEATGLTVNPGATFTITSILMGLLFVAFSFVVGYASAPSSPYYRERKKEFKRIKDECRDAKKTKQALESQVRKYKTKREEKQAVHYRSAQMCVNASQMIADVYLYMYNRAATEVNRKAYIHGEMPLDIPVELHPVRPSLENASQMEGSPA